MITKNEAVITGCKKCPEGNWSVLTVLAGWGLLSSGWHVSETAFLGGWC